MPDPVMLRATGLGRRFDELWAVRGMDLEVSRGEVLGLLGPNGAGKTTTVRLLTALIEPTEGRAWVDGLDVTERPEEVRARVGILTETPGLYEKLSATANLDFFGRLYGLDASTRAERIEHYLRLFSLWDRRDDVAGNFSKGMKQKLAIARALLHDPAVVFLDEPTAALDPEAAYIVREAIEALRRSGRTIVLATHNLDEADRLCDRVAFVRGGLLRVDSPAGLRAGAGRPWRGGRAGGAGVGGSGGGGAGGAWRDGRGGRRSAADRGLRGSGGGDAGVSSGRWSRRAPRSSRSASARRPSNRSISMSWASGPTMTRPPDAGTDRHDRPAPRVVRDRAQSAADVDDPPAADVPGHRTDRPGRGRRRSRASARTRGPGPGPATRVGGVHGRRSWLGPSPSSSSSPSSC